jgi:signal transduction histidine kinase
MDRSRPKTAVPIVELARNLPLGDLLALGTQLRGDLSPDLLLQDVTTAIARVLGFARVYVRLRNPDTDALEALAFTGLSDGDIGRLRATSVPPAHYQKLLHTGDRISESYLVPDDDHVLPASRRRQSQRLLLVPLRSHGDRLIGAIYVDPHGDHPLDTAGVQVLEAFARQAALALEHARLAARMQRLLAKEQLLTELGRDVSATLDMATILALTSERLAAAFPASTILLNDDDGIAQLTSQIGSIDQAGAHMALGRWVAQSGLPFLSNDSADEPRIALIGAEQPWPRGSQIAVPLRSGGRVIGALTAASPQTHAFTFEDVDLLEAVAAQIGGPIGGALLYQQTQRLAEQIRRRNEHLLVLNALASLAVSTPDIERLQADVTAQIHQGFGFGHVELYRIDEVAGEAILAARASRFDHGPVGYRQPLSRGTLGRAYESGRTVRINDVRAEPSYIAMPSFEGRSELCVPVVAGGRVLALLNLESGRESAFSDEDVEAIETAADVLAGALEKARLSQRAQEAAVLEERSRLARDLHDSISQQLFSMTLTSQAARAQLEKNPARAAVQLERLQETAAASLAEMRALIFQLRPPALSEQGLVGALQQHVASLDRREDLNVALEVEGDERHTRGVEQALYRIAQEALNNVMKHAGTCQVRVHLSMQPEQIVLTIADDGRGFDPIVKRDSGRHLGLVSMRERASELGGMLDLRSEQGRGTTIIVTVPRSEPSGGS